MRGYWVLVKSPTFRFLRSFWAFWHEFACGAFDAHEPGFVVRRVQAAAGANAAGGSHAQHCDCECECVGHCAQCVEPRPTFCGCVRVVWLYSWTTTTTKSTTPHNKQLAKRGERRGTSKGSTVERKHEGRPEQQLVVIDGGVLFALFAFSCAACGVDGNNPDRSLANYRYLPVTIS